MGSPGTTVFDSLGDQECALSGRLQSLQRRTLERASFGENFRKTACGRLLQEAREEVRRIESYPVAAGVAAPEVMESGVAASEACKLQAFKPSLTGSRLTQFELAKLDLNKLEATTRGSTELGLPKIRLSDSDIAAASRAAYSFDDFHDPDSRIRQGCLEEAQLLAPRLDEERLPHSHISTFLRREEVRRPLSAPWRAERLGLKVDSTLGSTLRSVLSQGERAGTSDLEMRFKGLRAEKAALAVHLQPLSPPAPLASPVSTGASSSSYSLLPPSLPLRLPQTDQLQGSVPLQEHVLRFLQAMREKDIFCSRDSLPLPALSMDAYQPALSIVPVSARLVERLKSPLSPRGSALGIQALASDLGVKEGSRSCLAGASQSRMAPQTPPARAYSEPTPFQVAVTQIFANSEIQAMGEYFPLVALKKTQGSHFQLFALADSAPALLPHLKIGNEQIFIKSYLFDDVTKSLKVERFWLPISLRQYDYLHSIHFPTFEIYNRATALKDGYLIVERVQPLNKEHLLLPGVRAQLLRLFLKASADSSSITVDFKICNMGLRDNGDVVLLHLSEEDSDIPNAFSRSIRHYLRDIATYELSLAQEIHAHLK